MKVLALLFLFSVSFAAWTDDVTEIFNLERQGAGLPSLTWNADLANAATQQSKYCSLDLSTTPNVGEIIVRGLGVAEKDAPKLFAALLVGEGKDWDCAKDQCPTGACMHHRQIIWESTTSFGCGCSNCGSKGYEMVCRFSGVGNLIGVHPLAKKGCPAPSSKRHVEDIQSFGFGLLSTVLNGYGGGSGGWGAGSSGSWGANTCSNSGGGWRITQVEGVIASMPPSVNPLWAWWNTDGRQIFTDSGFQSHPDGSVVPIPGGAFKGLDWTDQVLEIHNMERASFGVPPLKWDTALAAGAAEYAQQCVVSHSGARGLGENLAIGKGTDRGSTPKLLAALWAGQVYDWNCTSDKCTGHCSQHRQMIWDKTTKLGCGFASCGDLGFSLVCRYDCAGNLENVHPLKSLGAAACKAQKPDSSNARYGNALGGYAAGCGGLQAQCLNGYGGSSYGRGSGSWSGSGSGSYSSGQQGGYSSGQQGGYSSGQQQGYSGGQPSGGYSGGNSWGQPSGGYSGGNSWGQPSGGYSGGNSWGQSNSWSQPNGGSSWGQAGGAQGGFRYGSGGNSGGDSWGQSSSNGWTSNSQGCGGNSGGWGGGAPGWGTPSSSNSKGWRLTSGDETSESENPLFKWWSTDGRSARIDPGFVTLEDGTVIPLSASPVSGAEYIGVLPKTTAIIVIAICSVAGVIIVLLVAFIIIKYRKPSYVESA